VRFVVKLVSFCFVLILYVLSIGVLLLNICNRIVCSGRGSGCIFMMICWDEFEVIVKCVLLIL